MSRDCDFRRSECYLRLAALVLGVATLSGCLGQAEVETLSGPAGGADTESEEMATGDQEAADQATGAGEDEQPAAPADPNRVLRHAVFFAFKETSSDDDIQGVVDAFRALPAKIPQIIDFEWGTNNSPEGFDDGFTHCFLLTFQDEAGREVYLPHPEHKAFGDVLRPHMADVFVIDYWGTKEAGSETTEKKLRHAVFFKFKDDAAADAVAQIEQQFAELPAKIDAIKGFEWGQNNSPEKHDDDFTHAFLVTFADAEGRGVYLPHEAHTAFVEVLKPILDKVRVLDYVAQE